MISSLNSGDEPVLTKCQDFVPRHCFLGSLFKYSALFSSPLHSIPLDWFLSQSLKSSQKDVSFDNQER